LAWRTKIHVSSAGIHRISAHARVRDPDTILPSNVRTDLLPGPQVFGFDHLLLTKLYHAKIRIMTFSQQSLARA
jgi:hypothetical protein